MVGCDRYFHKCLLCCATGTVVHATVNIAENEWVPVSPKKEELSAATVTVTVAETRLQTEMVNQVFPSTVVTEVSVIPAGNKLA